MTIAFRTAVHYVPPTPLGLLPGKFVVTHTCRHCLEVVPTDALVDHAKRHGQAGIGQEPTRSA